MARCLCGVFFCAAVDGEQVGGMMRRMGTVYNAKGRSREGEMGKREPLYPSPYPRIHIAISTNTSPLAFNMRHRPGYVRRATILILEIHSYWQLASLPCPTARLTGRLLPHHSIRKSDPLSTQCLILPLAERITLARGMVRWQITCAARSIH